MNRLRDQKGAAVFTYVLFISVALLVLTPAVLLTVSTAAKNNHHDWQSKMAYNLAIGGIEALNHYLDEVPDNSKRVDYFTSYAGFGRDFNYKTPEQVQVTYKLRHEVMADPKYRQVISEAKVGGKTEKIVYQFTVENVTPASAPNGLIDPDHPQPAPEGVGIIVQGSYDGPSDVKTERKTVQHEIAEEISKVTTAVKKTYSDWDKQALFCNCNDPQKDIADIIKNYPNNKPIVIKTSNLNLKEGTYNFGTADQPIVLIVSNDLTMGSNNINLNVTGNLFVGTNYNINGNNANITISNMVNEPNQMKNYGDFYIVNGSLNGNNNGSIAVDNLMYATNISMNNNVSIHTGQLVVTNSFKIYQNTSLKVDKSFYTGNIDIYQNASITATANDILVRDHVNAHNNSSFTAGGLMVVGGNFASAQNEKQITIKTGGGMTAVQLDPSYGGGGGGSGPTSTSWAPQGITP
jgi:hypothetical protein